LVGILERFRGRLSDYDRHWLDYSRARMAGDNLAALRAIRRAAELAPGSKAVYNRAFMAGLYCERPREAVDALLSLDPERGPMRGWRSYFNVLVQAYSALNEREEALDAAQKYREIHGDDSRTLGYEAYALAGLGHVEEVNALLNDLVALPEEGLRRGRVIAHIAVYLRRHGHADAARATIDRAIEWYDARLPETKSSEGWRYGYARALYIADRCDDAHIVAKRLSQQFPEDFNYRGLVGLLAACRRDQEEALEVSRWLEALDRPYLRGDQTEWRSMIAGTLGDSENAVALLRQAMAEGREWPFLASLIWIAFESLRDYPPWQEFMRPKG
jgi:tetratricopeptide (TPR) repeat protein